MKKMFVDDILKKQDHDAPGAGQYESPKSFGKIGLTYSMASLLNEEDRRLQKSKKLPGPGSYSYAQVTG